MEDDELERFVDDWMTSKKRTYVKVEKFSGPGDLGGDVVGYRDERHHEGQWDNCQCKQLKNDLTEPDALRELSKTFYHCAEGADDVTTFAEPAQGTIPGPSTGPVQLSMPELLGGPPSELMALSQAQLALILDDLVASGDLQVTGRGKKKRFQLVPRGVSS
jgi:hypothetical protein